MPLELAGLESAQDEVEAYLRARGASASALYKVRLVLDELVANLMSHARFPGAPQPLRLEVEAGAEGILLAVEDAAAPFDPRTAPAPEGPPSLDDDRVGGLGLALVRRMVEIRDYRPVTGGWNRTELVIPPG